MKKILKITAIILLLLIISLVSIPFLFKDTIKAKILETINKNVNAEVSFEDASLNLFSNFPNATISLQKLKIVNTAPFQGDTLAYINDLSVKANLKNLIFKGENEPYQLLGFSISDAMVNIQINAEGKGNFDIAQPSETATSTEEKTNFSLNINQYSIDNLRVTFRDEASNMIAVLDSLYHKGKGDFSNDQLELNTTTQTNISFTYSGTQMMNKIPVSLDAILGIDLENQKYTFKDNSAKINKLPLEFNGFVQLTETGQNYDLTFRTPTSSFENFLGLIPETYAKNIEGIKTTGDFSVEGKIKGTYTENTIPLLDIRMFSNKSSFKYPDLPKAVRNIDIDVKIGNDTQKLHDTYVNINNLSFSIDEDTFSGKSQITNLIQNPNVIADIKGTINLANLKKAYPIKADLNLQGIFRANISTQFDMASIEKEKYENVRNAGSASLENFVYQGAEFVQPFHIDKASLNFNTAKIQLTEFIARTGKTDMTLKGFLDNFYGFMFRKEVLKGNFSLTSDMISVNDFMQKTTPNTEHSEQSQEKTKNTTDQAIKVPNFLDCTFEASAKTVAYDNLLLKNVSGKLLVKDEKVTLQNLRTDLFEGQIIVSGNVSTKEAKPVFDVDLDINKISILESFTHIEMLKKIAPIAKAVQGSLSSQVKVSGGLTPDMSADLNTIKGHLNASLENAQIKQDGTPLIRSLNTFFPKLNIAGMKLNDVKVGMNFDNGRVHLQPFDIRVNKDAVIKVSGSHGFDQSIDYNLVLDLPPSMLGADAERLLSKLSATEQQKLQNIPVGVGITGDFSKPKVSADMKSVIGNLAQQIAKGQANKLINKGIDEGMKILDGFLGKNKTNTPPSDSTQTDQKKEVKKAVNNIIDGLFNKQKK